MWVFVLSSKLKDLVNFAGECTMQQPIRHRDRQMRALHQPMVREHGCCISDTVLARCSSGDLTTNNNNIYSTIKRKHFYNWAHTFSYQKCPSTQKLLIIALWIQ